MSKNWKKIIIIVCVAFLLFLTLPAIVNYSNEKDMQKLEKILNTVD